MILCPFPAGFATLYNARELAGLPPCTLLDVLRHLSLEVHTEQQVRGQPGEGVSK